MYLCTEYLLDNVLDLFLYQVIPSTMIPRWLLALSIYTWGYVVKMPTVADLLELEVFGLMYSLKTISSFW